MLRTLAVTLVAICAAAPAAGQRLTDKEVTALAERIYHERDRFEDSLDGDFKHSMMRSETGEIDVNKGLDEFQDRANKYKDSLKSDYAASNELSALLRQASRIDAYMKQQASTMKGMSEWHKLATSLDEIARAYGVGFPLAEGAAVRRYGDNEVKEATEKLEEAAKELKKALERDLKTDTTVDQASKSQAVGDADMMAKTADKLKGRIDDGKPSTAEAEQLFAQAAKLQTFLQGRTLATASGAWDGLTTHLGPIAQAYGKHWP